MPRAESAMGKWKPSVDMRCLLRMMRPEEMPIQTHPVNIASTHFPEMHVDRLFLHTFLPSAMQWMNSETLKLKTVKLLTHCRDILSMRVWCVTIL